MNKLIIGLGISMFVIEILSLLGYVLVSYVSWSVNIAVVVSLVAFNIIAIGLFVLGSFMD